MDIFHFVPVVPGKMKKVLKEKKSERNFPGDWNSRNTGTVSEDGGGGSAVEGGNKRCRERGGGQLEATSVGTLGSVQGGEQRGEQALTLVGF